MQFVARLLVHLLVVVGIASLSAVDEPIAHGQAHADAKQIADVVVRVPLSLGGGSEPFVVALVNPGASTERDRIPALRLQLTSSPAFLATLPPITLPCGGGSTVVDCWADAMAFQLESTLVRHELATMRGTYWNLAGFFTGVAFGNEVNRMVQRVVQNDASFLSNMTAVLRSAVAANLEAEAPLEATSHTLGQLLFESGEGGIEEARAVLWESVLGQRSSTGPVTPPANVRVDNRREYAGFASWADAVSHADLEVVVVATDRTPELDALEWSAAALGVPRITVLGMGMKWPGFGLKVQLFAEHLLKITRPHEQGTKETLVLFLDAYDVLLLEPFARQLRARFLGLGSAVVFGAERACSPDTAMQVLYDDVLPAPPPPPARPARFLNSGSMIGLASDLAAVLADVVLDLEAAHGRALRRASDEAASAGEGSASSGVLLGGRGSATGPEVAPEASMEAIQSDRAVSMA